MICECKKMLIIGIIGLYLTYTYFIPFQNIRISRDTTMDVKFLRSDLGPNLMMYKWLLNYLGHWFKS